MFLWYYAFGVIILKFAIIIPVSLLSADFKDNLDKTGKLESFFLFLFIKTFYVTAEPLNTSNKRNH